MRLIKMTGGLGNQMFIYAMYLKMKTIFPDVRIDLSDMVHYQVHYGYEMNKVFHLPRTEFCINRSLKKIIEFLLFKTILERKQGGSLVPYTRKYHWPWIYFKGFYQSEKYFAGIEKEVRSPSTSAIDLPSSRQFFNTVIFTSSLASNASETACVTSGVRLDLPIWKIGSRFIARPFK